MALKDLHQGGAIRSLPLRRFQQLNRKPILPTALVAAIAFTGCLLPAHAQEKRIDPLTRFFDGMRKQDRAATPPAAEPVQADPRGTIEVPPSAVNGRPVPVTVVPAPPRIAPARPDVTGPVSVKQVPPTAAKAPVPGASVSGKSSPAMPPKAPLMRSGPAATPKSAPATPPSPPTAPASVTRTALPSTPEEGLAALNAHFNGIDQMLAAFEQVGGNGKREQGTLTLQRPGQFRFAYAAPSTLEIISDGRNVAIRDSRLKTNDVYPVSQTPLKFLVQENFDLARHTKVRDVRTAKDGTVTALFEDISTLGGTSIVELTYDAGNDRLVRWVVTDPQGFQTTVDLFDVEIVTSPAP